MAELIIENNNQKITIKLMQAVSFYERMYGLMFQDDVKPLLFIQKLPWRFYGIIHTFFMNETIDIIYISEDNKINETITLKPYRFYVPRRGNIKYIIELPENTLKKYDITLNSKLKVVI